MYKTKCNCGSIEPFCEKKIIPKFPNPNNVPREIILGSDRTMITPSNPDACMSNINGINKPMYSNPYGKVGINRGDQSYGYCVAGINNAFSDSSIPDWN
jgi:hypothetical protein